MDAQNTSKASVQLPAESLEKIFSEFKNQKSFLLRCALVNRSWCRQVVKLIWSNPFQPTEKDKRLPSSFFQTLFWYLSEDDRINLRNYYFEIQEINQPTFNYPSFIKELDFGYFSDNYPKGESTDGQAFFEIVTAVCKIILENSTGLEYIGIRAPRLYSVAEEITRVPNFQQYPQAGPVLSQLKSFYNWGDIQRFESEDMPNIINLVIEIKNVTKFLACLGIDFRFIEAVPSLGDHFLDLIKNQDHLQEIFFYLFDSGCNKFLSALSPQAKNLKTLRFIETKKAPDLSLIAGWTALKTIQIHNSLLPSDEPVSKFWEPLATSMIRLNKFEVSWPRLDKDFLLPVINDLMEDLTELKIHPSNNISRSIFQAIGLYCRSLVSLSIPIYEDTLIEFLECLSNLRYLEELTAFAFHDPNFEEFLPMFAEALPKSLHDLDLRLYRVSWDALENFVHRIETKFNKILFYPIWMDPDERIQALSDKYCEVKKPNLFVGINVQVQEH
ncbi:hypothetical protein G9A89_019634 [Geosiphon pyriformis]|nr:hypothetical protein G9A89_019634 [Geosiphon pyriformis]